MSIKLEMLRCFRIVAEQGSLTAAAAVLGRTPSAVSMTLSQLEDHIGAPLFETDRKNRLTSLGLLVLDESRRATDAFSRSLDAIGRHAVSTAGTVRIATVPSATFTVLPGVIAAFRALRPDVRLEISDVDSASVRSRIKIDAADIGILSAAPEDPADGSVILQDELGVVCRKDGKIAKTRASGEPASWALFDHEPIIANPLCHMVAHPTVHKQIAACNLEARNTTALLSFVRSGLGATVLPRSAIHQHLDELTFIQPSDPPVRRQLRKIRNETHHPSPAAEAFWLAL